MKALFYLVAMLVGIQAILSAPAADPRIERNRVYQFNKWLKEAEDAMDEGSAKMASKALAAARKNQPALIPDPKRLARLERRIADALIPVAVTLKSDGKTLVSIPNMVPPSRFRTKAIKLPIGIHVAKGVRRDYEDEEVQFEVQMNQPGVEVRVECKIPKK